MEPEESSVDDVLNRCLESEDEGRSLYPGMTYEQGVRAAIEWLRGHGSHPLDE